MSEPTEGDLRVAYTRWVGQPLLHAAEELERSADPADRKDGALLRRVAARTRLRLERRLGA